MRTTISAVLMLIFLAVPRAQADSGLNALSALAADIQQLSDGGEWHAGGAAGTLRFIVTGTAPGAATSRFFVQWIRHGGAVVATAEIAEIRQTPQRLTDFRIQVVAEGTDVFIDTREAASGAIGEYMLLLAGPGAYEFTPLSN
jgi:hypothetical protein